MGSVDRGREESQRSLTEADGLVIELLGEPRIMLDGRDIALGLPYDKLRLLLAYWLTEGRTSFLRADLATLFWPDAEPGQARSSLRKALSHLRRVFSPVDPPIFGVDRDRIRILANPRQRIDAQCLTAVSIALEGEQEKPSTEELQEALALYRGDFLSGIKVRGEDELDTWLQNRRLDYRRHALQICQALVSRFREEGKPNDAVLVARRGMEIDPDDEAMHVSLLRALKDAGQTTVARIESDRFLAHLSDVLDVEPSEALIAIRRTLPQGTSPKKDTTASQNRRWSAVVLRVEQRGLGDAPELRRGRMDLAELAGQVAAQGGGYKLTAGADGLETLTFGYPYADSAALMQALDAAHRMIAERDDLAIAIEQGCVVDDVEPTDNPVGDVFPISHALLARCAAGEILVGERAASGIRPYYRLTRKATLRTRTRPSIKLIYWASQGRHAAGEVICQALPTDPDSDRERYEQIPAGSGLVLQGELGAGKTYGLTGLLEWARRAEDPSVWLQCLPGDRLRPLAALARWLRACIGETTPAAELPVRRALVGFLGDRRESLESIEPLAVTLLTELVLRNERMRLGRGEFDAQTLAARLAPVFQTLFVADQTLLLVDNVDEADDLLVGWLNDWIEASGDAGRFVLTCRALPDGLILPENTRSLQLGKLSKPHSRRLIGQFHGDDVVSTSMISRLMALAAGNPGRLIALADWSQHLGVADSRLTGDKQIPPSLLLRLGANMSPADGPADRSVETLDSDIWSYLFGDAGKGPRGADELTSGADANAAQKPPERSANHIASQ